MDPLRVGVKAHALIFFARRFNLDKTNIAKQSPGGRCQRLPGPRGGQPRHQAGGREQQTSGGRARQEAIGGAVLTDVPIFYRSS